MSDEAKKMAEVAPQTPWEEAVQEEQQCLYEKFGDRDWDCYKCDEEKLLERNLGYAIFGRPDELPESENDFTGYPKEKLTEIRKVSAIIKKHSKDSPECQGSEMLVSTIFVFLNREDQLFPFPVFRIPGCDPKDAKKAGPEKFVDSNCRVYKDWDDFLKSNQLPSGSYCYPRGGVYIGDENDKVILDFGKTPASSFTNTLLSVCDTASSLIMVGGMAVSLTAMFTAVAAPVAAAASAGAIWTGVYGASRSTQTLVDRGRHEQSVGLKDTEARNCWISAASNVLGIASAKGVAYLTKVTQSGEVLGRTGRVMVTALNYGSLAANGLGLFSTFVALCEKHNSEGVTPLEVFQFGSSLLFFSMSAMNTKTASAIIKETQSGIINEFEGSLRSNRHRRMFRRVAKQTQGNDGNSMQGNAKVIRGINHITDKDDFFAGLVRVQKQLSRSGATVSFTDTGLVEINGGLQVHPMDFSEINKAQRQVILDATKKLSERILTRQQFNEEVKTFCREQEIVFRLRRTETIASINKTVSSDTSGKPDGLKNMLSKMDDGQVDTVTSCLWNFAQEHHQKILDISIKLAEGLGFKKTAEFLHIVEFFVQYINEMVNEVEAKYQSDLKNAQSSQGNNFNRAQFDENYHNQGDRRQNFIRVVLTNYNTVEAMGYVKKACQLFMKVALSESRDSVEMEADSNSHVETTGRDQGAGGNSHVETTGRDQGAGGNSHVETTGRDQGAG
ncbi:hypothetical protein B7P43_G04997, partial [Cryptotermes secundus]